MINFNYYLKDSSCPYYNFRYRDINLIMLVDLISFTLITNPSTRLITFVKDTYEMVVNYRPLDYITISFFIKLIMCYYKLISH